MLKSQLLWFKTVNHGNTSDVIVLDEDVYVRMIDEETCCSQENGVVPEQDDICNDNHYVIGHMGDSYVRLSDEESCNSGNGVKLEQDDTFSGNNHVMAHEEDVYARMTNEETCCENGMILKQDDIHDSQTDGLMIDSQRPDDISDADDNSDSDDKCNPDNNSDPEVVTGFVKIVFYFYQIETVLRIYDSDVEQNVSDGIENSVRSFFNFDFISHTGLSSTSCAFLDNTPTLKVATRVGFVATIFLALGLIYFISKAFIKMRKNLASASQEQGRGSLCDKVLIALFEVFLLNYSAIIKATFALLNCVQVEEMSVLHLQGNIVCYQKWQYVLIGFGIAWIIPFCVYVFVLPGMISKYMLNTSSIFLGCILPLPLLVYSLLQRRCCQADEEDGLSKKNFVTAAILKNRIGPFRKNLNNTEFLSWEGVYISRRLVIVALFTFMQDPLYRLYLILFVQTLILLHHVHFKPYKSVFLNIFETISLTALILINSMNLFAVYDYTHGIKEEGAKLDLLKVFAWIEMFTVSVVPLVVAVVFVVLVIGRLGRLIFVCVRNFVKFFRSFFMIHF